MIRVTIEVEDELHGDLKVVTKDRLRTDGSSDTTTLNRLVRSAHEQADAALLAKRNPRWRV